MRRRKRNHSILIAGALALISAAGLIAIISLSDGALKSPDATDQQHTVDAVVRTRLAGTAEMKTQIAVTEAATQKSP